MYTSQAKKKTCGSLLVDTNLNKSQQCAQVAQRGCEVPILGDIQKLFGHNPGNCV